MAEKLKWKVIRAHDGDRHYKIGDVREGSRAELGHLEGKVLELESPESKSETASPENKSESPAENKTETPGRKINLK